MDVYGCLWYPFLSVDFLREQPGNTGKGLKNYIQNYVNGNLIINCIDLPDQSAHTIL